MKTNDELIEEKARVLIAPGIGVRYLTEEDVRTILTQKDAEVAEAVQKLRTEEQLYIGKTQYEFYKGDVRWVYNQALDDLITGLTPHPTDDTSDKTN